MRVLLLSDTFSEHTEKWALGLVGKGIEVGLFSFNKADYEWHNHPLITVFFEPPQKINAESMLTKLSYIKYVSVLKKILKHFKPDILHAHYATSYGLVGSLSGFHPFIISVWGSDVYDFPKRSRLHRKILQYNLNRADLLLSTSHIMKQETALYTSKPLFVTPFGVDVNLFSPSEPEEKEAGLVNIGTIKPIEEKYGIEFIIKAAQILIKEQGHENFRFYLIGSGHDLDSYRNKIIDLGLQNYFVVSGRIPFSQISRYHNLLDIFLNVSIDDSESFGVAAVEAMACEKPVIVTDVGGLLEVVNNGEFGKVIPRSNEQKLAEAILELVLNPTMARQKGQKARQHVLKYYNWENNLAAMIQHYELLIQGKTGQ